MATPNEIKARIVAICEAAGLTVVTAQNCDAVTLPFVRVAGPRRATKRVISQGQSYQSVRQFDVFLYVQQDCDPAKPAQMESALAAAGEQLDTISDLFFANMTLKLAGGPNIGAKLQNEITDSGVQADTFMGNQYSVVVTSLTIEANRSTS
jgi:hypothetical protein